jgi:hypothetical protein
MADAAAESYAPPPIDAVTVLRVSRAMARCGVPHQRIMPRRSLAEALEMLRDEMAGEPLPEVPTRAAMFPETATPPRSGVRRTGMREIDW